MRDEVCTSTFPGRSAIGSRDQREPTAAFSGTSLMESPEPNRVEAFTASPQWFATTHWSVVMQAGSPDSPQALEALEKLCRAWLPLYSYVRRRGYGAHDAQDLTQGFFVRLLRMNSFAGVSREKGKFRTFLLAALN